MDQDVRRGIALIAGCVILAKAPCALYDFATASSWSFSGTIDAARVNVYDQALRCYITGSVHPGAHLDLYHLRTNQHIILDVAGREFSGYGFKNSKRFHGYVKDDVIHLYDHDGSRNQRYRLGADPASAA